MHTMLVFSSVYVASLLVTGSLIVVSTKRNRIPLLVILIVFPFIVALAVGSTIADFLTGKAKQRVYEATIGVLADWKSAVDAVETKRVQMFGGSFRETKFANALRERYCIHLTKSADSITNWFAHRMAA